MSEPPFRMLVPARTTVLPSRTDPARVRRDPRRDLLAGPTVAVVALPLALGFGIVVMASGIRPAHRRILGSVGALDLPRHKGPDHATTPEVIGAARGRPERIGVLRPGRAPAPEPAVIGEAP
ncbi:hypothetical protein ACFYOV_16395 [Streptomyces sp. NPDC005931]|uniref:hypothetical protein n=1 Tax=Streptomyces sp. NPDC005931 TaxID=3364737 RepID=UPI0036BEC44C